MTITQKPETISNLYPVLSLRDIVVFPGMIVPLFVGRQKSVKALEEASNSHGKLMLVTQREAGHDDPRPEDMYRIGVVANILQLLKLPDGTIKVLVEGLHRAEIHYFLENKTYFEAQIVAREVGNAKQEETEALMRSVLNGFERYLKFHKKIPVEMFQALQREANPVKLADAIAAHLILKIPEKQDILEMDDVNDKLEKIFSVLEREVGVLNTERKIRSRVRNQMEKSQKEYYLNEQMKAIQKELGDSDIKDELAELEKKIKEVKLSKEAQEKAASEFKKLRHMSPMSAEASVIRSYLDWLLGLPWESPSELKHDLAHAELILDEEHYGLEKVKERITEFLAVQQRMKSVKGQILCLVGPPGVGKTSLAKSIANATGRSFARISLGGVRDESEIRGHRRTYIGSLPGKIIQNMKKVKTSNPLLLLDEIDKLGQDFRGDPAAALLEVLDPEQNSDFNDHYLEVGYDLSEVMFITTANTTATLPRPLLDRMEIIRISGYTEDEKVEIAKRHLLPKMMKEHGLSEEEWVVSDAALRNLIQRYTRESGVRNLERELAKLARKAVKEILKSEKTTRISITPKNLKKYAGVERFDYNMVDKDDHVGVTTGLAYTETGGDLLPIEAVLIPGGKGRIQLTGKLGDVMQESAQAAWSYVRSRSHEFGIRPKHYHNNDIHIHVPEGAIPKDGPSAGAAMCTTIVSALTGIPVRKDIAMTGEISLRGMVMPIGGLKEKLLAALRGGIKVALIPEKNVKDLEEIPDNVKKGLEIIAVNTVAEVLHHALVTPLSPLLWEDVEAEIAAFAAFPESEEAVVRH